MCPKKLYHQYHYHYYFTYSYVPFTQYAVCLLKGRLPLAHIRSCEMTASLVPLTGARATTAAFFMPVKTPSEERGCILRLYQPVSLDSGPFKFFLSVPSPHSILNSEVQYLPPPLPPRLSSRNQISWILTDLQHLPECVK